jgi:hypothetical protein
MGEALGAHQSLVVSACRRIDHVADCQPTRGWTSATSDSETCLLDAFYSFAKTNQSGLSATEQQCWSRGSPTSNAG